MGKFTKGVARFISRKFLAEDMRAIKEEFHQEEIQKVHSEIEYYKSVINKLQQDKNELSSLKFKEQVHIQSKSLDLDKSDVVQIENPYSEYLR